MNSHLIQTIHLDGFHNGHIQGIAIDARRNYIYVSFTTCLVKADLQGNVIGTVTGLAGHLGCIAYNYEDDKVYGSLEFKHDSIGTNILKSIGRADIQDGFYMTIFDVDKITHLGMDAEKDGIMTAVYLKQVYDDYSAEGHRYGCSGIDGTTFAPAFGQKDGNQYLYVAYGIYGDNDRTDNDHQVILRYDTAKWASYARPLDQCQMHRSGPAAPDGVYFLYTGNTRWGIQNLEYDPFSRTMLAAVYVGSKEQFPNYHMFFIDCDKAPVSAPLTGLQQEGQLLSLASLGETDAASGIRGSHFPYGATGMASLGDGHLYISHEFRNEDGFGSDIRLYALDKTTGDFSLV